MKELISIQQANDIMIVILIAGPVIGALYGWIKKELIRSVVYGTVIGFGNFALWSIYNAITNSLGLDTVKNLLVNLALFIIVGVVAGLVIGRFDRHESSDKITESAD